MFLTRLSSTIHGRAASGRIACGRFARSSAALRRENRVVPERWGVVGAPLARYCTTPYPLSRQRRSYGWYGGWFKVPD
jgi:hypothetical protein